MTPSERHRRVVLTGASGLVGSALVGLLAGMTDLVAVGRSPGGLETTTEWIEADLCQPRLADRLPRSVDAVVHLAQSRHYREFPSRAADIFGVNVAATTQLLDWAHRAGARTFVYASSGGVYTHDRTCPNKDDVGWPRQPLGYYLASKQAAEVLAEAYTEVMTIVVLRFFFVYGPGQAETMLIPRLLRSVVGGRPITLDGRNGLRTNPVYVGDAARAVAAALTLPTSALINVAGPEVLCLREIAEAIGHAVGTPPMFINRESEPRDLIGDITNMVQVLGPPTTPFSTGITYLADSMFHRSDRA